MKDKTDSNVKKAETFLLSVRQKDGTMHSFSAAPPGDIESFFVFSLHKAGSTMLNNVFHMMCGANGIPVISFEDQLFGQGVESLHVTSVRKELPARGYGFIGFRYFPFYLEYEDVADRNKVLLVRDPRDMLVSHYFSSSLSHIIPDRGQLKDQLTHIRNRVRSVDINAYCLAMANWYLSALQAYLPLLDQDKLLVYRYEDIIFRKEDVIVEAADFLGIPYSKATIGTILGAVDVFPEEESPGKHIRQVRPGNYAKHLSPETIARLNEKFSRIGAAFGYRL